VKRLFRRDRPEASDHPHELRRPRTSSFPSGHASSAVMAATLLSASHRRARPLWWALAAAVAWSRVHVKVHHASDVLGGAVLGRILGRLARRFWPV
jgi:undecaprenyl-diphosphatase